MLSLLLVKAIDSENVTRLPGVEIEAQNDIFNNYTSLLANSGECIRLTYGSENYLQRDSRGHEYMCVSSINIL
jgi:hypothetical protein